MLKMGAGGWEEREMLKMGAGGWEKELKTIDNQG